MSMPETLARFAVAVAVVPALLVLPGPVAGQRAPAEAPAATAAPPAGPPDFSDIVRRLAPSVVAVTTRTAIDEAEREWGQRGGPLGDLFRRHFGPGPQYRRPSPRGALGSGFIIDDAGHVVTNNHVVARAGEIRIVLADGTSHTARLVGLDPATDLAVLRFDQMPAGLRPLGWGQSSAVEPGAWTIAIGSPFGLGGTVTVGVLSARSRDIRSGPYDDFLQTDASINSGNSGGPLFDANGRVIGVNTAIFSPSGGSVGIGFAIPSDLARTVVAELIAKGRVERGYIGASLQPVSPELAQSFGLDRPRGALVASVTPRGPAGRAGMRPGDVIVAFAGQDVGTIRELMRSVAASTPGSQVAVTVLRDGRQVNLQLTIEPRPGPQQVAAPAPDVPAPAPASSAARLGVYLAPLDGFARQRAGLEPDETGVLVEEVMPGGLAAESGLQQGDIIVGAGNAPVTEPGDIVRYWERSVSQGGPPPYFRVRRGEDYVFIAIKPQSAATGRSPG